MGLGRYGTCPSLCSQNSWAAGSWPRGKVVKSKLAYGAGPRLILWMSTGFLSTPSRSLLRNAGFLLQHQTEGRCS
jgi:hypothetical protein